MADDRANAKAVSVEGRKATYRSCFQNAPTASKLFCQIQGNASKIIKITEIVISANLTTSAPGYFGIYKAPAAVATPVGTAAVVPSLIDSQDAVAAALINSYTAADFVGSDVQVVGRNLLFGSATVLPGILTLIFGKNGGKSITLRGASEFLKFYIQSTSFAGAAVNVEIEHTEEAA